MIRKATSAAFVVGSLAIAAASQAAVLGTYTFAGNSNGSNPASNTTLTPVAYGTSVSAPVYTADFYSSAPVLTINRTNDTAAQAYFQVTITAAAGFELNMDSFTFDGARGGGATPRTYEVHSSVGGLAISTDPTTPGAVLASGQFTTARGASGTAAVTNVDATGLRTITTDLSSAAYDHLSSLTMRVFFYTPTVAQNIDLDNFTFNGSVNAVAVPEPVTGVAGTLLAATILRRRRR